MKYTNFLNNVTIIQTNLEKQSLAHRFQFNEQF